MQVGFYGKLPSHGDFLRRRVSDAFVDAWDAWLRECLAASRTELGARWLDIYLTSPAWRFVCAAGACGPAPVMGLLAPSVDQVGRYFPITIVSELPAQVSLVTAAASARFFESAERVVIETLASERVDFDRFDRGVVALEQELGAIALPRGSRSTQRRRRSWVTLRRPGSCRLPPRRMSGSRSSRCCLCTSRRNTGHL